jgi:hypothetical protein
MLPNARPGVDQLLRVGFVLKPDKFIVERRPLGQIAVGSPLPTDVTKERVAMLYDQNYVGLSTESRAEFLALHDAWSRRMTEIREGKNDGKTVIKPPASEGKSRKRGVR